MVKLTKRGAGGSGDGAGEEAMAGELEYEFQWEAIRKQSSVGLQS